MSSENFLMPKFRTCARGSITLGAQDYEQHGKIHKSLLHPRLPSPPPCLKGQSLALADMLTMILWDLEDHLSTLN